MWLRQGENKPKRSNDIAAVIKECGDHCFACGTDFDKIRQRRIGTHVHHTRPFAEHGEKFPKIPLCALCHEVISALQRQMPKLLGD
jgi:predicted HNH restriction endonuclease